MEEQQFEHDDMGWNLSNSKNAIEMHDKEELYSWPASWVMLQPGPNTKFEFATNATVSATVEETGSGLRIMSDSASGNADYPHFQIFVSLENEDIDKLITHLESIKEKNGDSSG